MSRRPVGASRSRSVSKYWAVRAEPDVLEHADRRDGVELLAPQVPVVLVADLDPVLEPGLAHPPLRLVDLLVAEGHADHPGAVVAGGVEGHRAPAAAHVEQAGPGCGGRGPSLRQMSSYLAAWASSRVDGRGRRTGRTSRSSSGPSTSS